MHSMEARGEAPKYLWKLFKENFSPKKIEFLYLREMCHPQV